MNPVLQSEGFERAAYALARSLDNFNTGSFDQGVATFQRSVDKIVAAMGMQAENQNRAHAGLSPAYDESAFQTL